MSAYMNGLNGYTAYPSSADAALVHKLTRIGDELYDNNRLRDYDKLILERALDHVRAILASDPGFAGSKLVMYGSNANGFGSRNNCDIDVSLVTRTGRSDKGQKQQLVLKLYSLLRYKVGITDLQQIATARVPIIKFSLMYGGKKFECDISIDNQLAVENTKLLKTYTEVDERAAKLGLMVKSFMKSTALHGRTKGQLNSYACCLMTIHYLQQCDPPVLPVLQETLGYHSYDIVSNTASCGQREWPVCFLGSPSVIQRQWSDYGRNTMSVGELFVDLLDFYGNKFAFNSQVVNIHQKAPLRRPVPFVAGWQNRDVSIQDPLEKCHNLGFSYKFTHISSFAQWFRANLEYVSGRFVYSIPPVKAWMDSF